MRPGATIAGVRVELTPALVLVIAGVALASGVGWLTTGGPAVMLFIVVSALAVHEAGHAVVARHLRVGVSAVELGVLGGKTSYADPRMSRPTLAGVAAAGPLASLVVGVTLALVSGDAAVIDAAAGFNLLVGLFNLVPVAGSDGASLVDAMRGWPTHA